jgi:hypothetical protein
MSTLDNNELFVLWRKAWQEGTPMAACVEPRPQTLRLFAAAVRHAEANRAQALADQCNKSAFERAITNELKGEIQDMKDRVEFEKKIQETLVDDEDG